MAFSRYTCAVIFAVQLVHETFRSFRAFVATGEERLAERVACPQGSSARLTFRHAACSGRLGHCQVPGMVLPSVYVRHTCSYGLERSLRFNSSLDADLDPCVLLSFLHITKVSVTID